MNILNALKGKKTYLVSAAACVILFGAWQGWWKVPPEIYAMLGALAAATLRHAISQADPETVTVQSPKPEVQSQTPMPRIVPALLAMAGLALLAGCAVNYSSVHSYSDQGEMTGKGRSIGFSLWDGQANVTKARVQVGRGGTSNNVYAPGIYLAGVGEQSSSPTNMMEQFGELLGTAARIYSGGAVAPGK